MSIVPMTFPARDVSVACAAPAVWRECEVEGIRAAEEMLDRLERDGVAAREVRIEEGRVLVRWMASAA